MTRFILAALAALSTTPLAADDRLEPLGVSPSTKRATMAFATVERVEVMLIKFEDHLKNLPESGPVGIAWLDVVVAGSRISRIAVTCDYLDDSGRAVGRGEVATDHPVLEKHGRGGVTRPVNGNMTGEIGGSYRADSDEVTPGGLPAGEYRFVVFASIDGSAAFNSVDCDATVS